MFGVAVAALLVLGAVVTGSALARTSPNEFKNFSECPFGAPAEPGDSGLESCFGVAREPARSSKQGKLRCR